MAQTLIQVQWEQELGPIGDLEEIEWRGEINGKAVSMALFLGHKIAVTLLVNRVMVQRRKKRHVTCFLYVCGKAESIENV